MNRTSSILSLSHWIRASVVVGLLGLTACDKSEVTSYTIPNEAPAAPAMAGGETQADPHAGMAMSPPAIRWTHVPEGWTQSTEGSGMRLATFVIAGDEGQGAEMAIIPMGGFAGTEEQLVNMWRAQLGLLELAEADAEGQGQAVTIGGSEGKLYEMAGQAQDTATRILVASVNKGGANFFFKLIGRDAVVAEQKEPFFEFLEGVEFSEGEPMGTAPSMTAERVPAETMQWEAPESWEELPPTQFLLAKYRIPGDVGASAEVTVSKLGGNAGGMLPNVNRWRAQLNLAPVDEAGLEPLLSDIEAGSMDATLVTLDGTDLQTGAPARMLAVIVPLPAETWFFKMTGPTPVMETKAAEFRSFVNAARF